METYQVSKECISCHACVEVAGDNFAMGENNLAFVKRQPASEAEFRQCRTAKDVCPVEAISSAIAAPGPVLASHNVRETLETHPQLKEVLIGFSPKFKKLLNPVMYYTVARFASFHDAARVSGISVCEILHILNGALGTVKELSRIAPECVKEQAPFNIFSVSREISWPETADRYIYNHDSMTEIIEMVNRLAPQQNLVLIAVEEPLAVVKTAQGLNLWQNVTKERDYRISLFNPAQEVKADWREQRNKFFRLDVRTMASDPFDIIIQKAYSLQPGEGFILIQSFEPFPMINMLAEMGFEHESEHRGSREVWVYFYKTPDTDDTMGSDSEKTEVVIQSATPVAYPVIMRLLQSENIRKKIAIRELKVWEETEKHLAWIANGRADISFSAVITSFKLKNADIKMPAFLVWDNFVLLSRQEIHSFEDVQNREIYTPLFEEAPPTKITKYLIKASGLDPEQFQFRYGQPFGRPEEIYASFVSGEADTVILREPEASYAIKIMQDRGIKVFTLQYSDIWNQINPGFGSFPNAGLVLKGEFARKHPDVVKLFLSELKEAIQWVNDNRIEAARLAFDMMRQPPDRIELFLNRVNFQYMEGQPLLEKVKSYFEVLLNEGIVTGELDSAFYDMFRLEP